MQIKGTPCKIQALHTNYRHSMKITATPCELKALHENYSQSMKITGIPCKLQFTGTPCKLQALHARIKETEETQKKLQQHLNKTLGVSQIPLWSNIPFKSSLQWIVEENNSFEWIWATILCFQELRDQEKHIEQLRGAVRAKGQPLKVAQVSLIFFTF